MADERAGEDRPGAGPAGQAQAGQGQAGQGQAGYPNAVERYRVLIGAQALTVDVIERDAGLFVSVDEGPELPVDVLARRDDGEIGLVLAGRLLRGLVGARPDGRSVVHDGESVDVTVLDERAARLASAAQHARPHVSETAVRAPMPGLVVAVPVEAGQAVKEGTTLVVLSAMKMQNELTAHEDATVKEVLVSAGQTVDQNQVLLRLE